MAEVGHWRGRGHPDSNLGPLKGKKGGPEHPGGASPHPSHLQVLRAEKTCAAFPINILQPAG